MDNDQANESVSRARHLLTQLIEVDKIISKVSTQGPTSTQRDGGVVDDAIGESSSVGKVRKPGQRHAPPKNSNASLAAMTLPAGGSTAARARAVMEPIPVLAIGVGGKPKLMSTLKKKGGTKVTKPVEGGSLDGGFSKPQMSYCPKCYKDMPLGALRQHMAEECANNDITCPEHDCEAVFPADHLKVHLATECVAAKRRKKLVDVARARKEKEAEEARLAIEAALVYVQPKKDKVKDDFVMDDVSYHSGLAPPPAPAEREVTEGPCEACNKYIEFALMPEHKLKECLHRLVYCTNYHGGCSQLVPFGRMSEHIKNECFIEKFKNELVTKAMARCAIVKCIGCGKACEVKHLLQHETQECIYRKVPCKNAAKGCPVMVREKDRARHEEVDGVAKIRYALYVTGDGSYVDLREDDLRCPWTCEFWLYRISSREAVKQHLRNAFEMVPRLYDSFLLEYVWQKQMEDIKVKLADKTMSLEARDDIMSILADTVEAFEDAAVISTMRCTELGCCLMSARRAMTEFLGPNAELVKAKADSAMGKVLVRELMGLKRNAPGHEAPKEERFLPKPESRPPSREASRPSSAVVKQQAKVERQVAAWKPTTGGFGISALAVTMRLQADPMQKENKEAYESALEEWQAKKADLQQRASKGQVFLEEGGGSNAGDEDAEAREGKDYEREKVFEKESAQLALLEPLQPIPPKYAQLVIDAIKPEERGHGGVGIINGNTLKTIMSWSEWYDVLCLMQTLLDTDMDNLYNLRVLGGILKDDRQVDDDDSSIASASLASMESEEAAARAAEKALREQQKKAEEERKKKKEKEKLRREMKRNKGKKEQEEEVVAGDDAEAEVDERTPEQILKDKRKAEREKKREVREKLVPRLNDAAKSSAGRDVLMFSDSANGRGAYNKICLDMSYPGEYDDFTPAKKKDKNPKPKYWFENQGGGMCGVVCSDNVLGGAERYDFGKAVPREKWVHCAFVANKEPSNRITFMMDGLVVGQVKDCAFPLPMSCLAGSSGLDGFAGCLIDARIWTKQRSQMEVRGTMNMLLDIEGDQESKAIGTDLTAKGLVAWWTFEEGPNEDDKVTDVSEHRAPIFLNRSLRTQTFDRDHQSLVDSNVAVQEIHEFSLRDKYIFKQGTMHGRYWSWENAEECPLPWDAPLKPGEIRSLPVPAFSQTSLCQVELRQLALAKKGRLLHRQIDCTLGCDAFILKKDLRFHVQYVCELRLMKCRHAPLCKGTFVEKYRLEHEETTCTYLTKLQKLVVVGDRHRALLPCQLCSTLVRVRDKDLHDRAMCAHRVVECTHADCKFKVQAHRLKYHLKFECESKAVTKRAILVSRARERTHYPRDWGAVIEYDLDEEEDPGPEITPLQDPVEDGAPRRKVVIIPDDFDKDLRDAAVGEADAGDGDSEEKAAAIEAATGENTPEIKRKGSLRA